MRQAFCNGMEMHARRHDFVFLTGDLGFRALESLRDSMGERFINAGVAEQNMISVAAGLAKTGFRPWVYSIAPFLYARPFEQIRNDVCMHRLPIVLVGNGGGYGYGVMGATHHALEDYGVLLTLREIAVFIPVFDRDLADLIPGLFAASHPSYLRLGLSEQPSGTKAPRFAPWRKLVSGRNGVVVVVGPLAGTVWGASCELPEDKRPNVWCLSQLPLGELPDELWSDLRSNSTLVIAEEHVAHGSAGQALSMMLIRANCVPNHIRHLTALGYPSGLYGSQKFHRAESGLNAASILAELSEKTAE